MDENSDDTLIGGARVVTLSSWHEFHQKVRSLKCKRGYVWRGQRKDWPLLSSFDREVESEDEHDRAKKLQDHLASFKEAMNRFYPGVLPKKDDDVWALGQQYRLRSPLLDWTLSPYIAAYFAFSEEIDQDTDCHRYVYALNRSVERLLSKRKKGSQVLSLGRCVSFIEQPAYPNRRFTAQRGIFTKALQGIDIWTYVRSFSKKRPSEVAIVKFEIPTNDREEALRELQSMNIDDTSLLLDLHNAVDCCNRTLSPRCFALATTCCPTPTGPILHSGLAAVNPYGTH